MTDLMELQLESYPVKIASRSAGPVAKRAFFPDPLVNLMLVVAGLATSTWKQVCE